MPGFGRADSANPYADLRRPWPFDPARAARLLELAGYPRGDQFPPLVLATSPRFQPISEFLQQSWGQLGIRVVIDNLEGAAQRERIYNQQVGLWRASWLADYPDAENFLALFVEANWAPAGPNTTHYKNSAFDKLYAQALRTPQDSLRYPIYQQLEELLVRDLPVIPLYHYRAMRLLQPDIRGLPLSPMTLLLDLKYAWKE
jgi:peptide/nickel transport system substrate-binding protein